MIKSNEIIIVDGIELIVLVATRYATTLIMAESGKIIFTTKTKNEIKKSSIKDLELIK